MNTHHKPTSIQTASNGIPENGLSEPMNSFEADNLQCRAVVELTQAAANHVKHILANTPNAKGLRLGVKTAGCSGFSYVIDCAQEVTASDTLYETQEVQIVIDDKSMPYLKGMVIDCVTEGLNKTLKFLNPNVTGSCGCGESFSIEG